MNKRRPWHLRFWEKVDQSGDCWIWTASTKNGYGQFQLNRDILYAHRLSWELVNGTVPLGKFICHTCDERRCVNPSHLWAGTHLDNQRDCWRKERSHFQKAGNPNQKLSDQQVREIHQLLNTVKITREIAFQYGVTTSQIRHIATGFSRSGVV